MSWNKDKFYKEGNYYRGPEEKWEHALYGFYPRGLGDLIYNTLRVILETNDMSEWAQDSLLKCVLLLHSRKRWPDRMNPIQPKDKKPYRSQYSMTRDPWVTLYACAVFLDKKEYIEMKPPWYLYRPELWSLRRVLLGKWSLFKLWHWMTPASKNYVKALDRIMLWTYIHR